MSITESKGAASTQKASWIHRTLLYTGKWFLFAKNDHYKPLPEDGHRGAGAHHPHPCHKHIRNRQLSPHPQ